MTTQEASGGSQLTAVQQALAVEAAIQRVAITAIGNQCNPLPLDRLILLETHNEKHGR
jgi:hypothetical protein